MKATLWQILTVVLALLVNYASDTGMEQNLLSRRQNKKELTAKEILGNPAYLAISYGGYRENSRELQPTVAQLKEDMKILAAMNVRVLRTYNTKFAEASNKILQFHFDCIKRKLNKRFL